MGRLLTSFIVARQNGMCFSAAVQRLFYGLSHWGPSNRGLTLELSAYSPCDAKDIFQSHSFDVVSYDEGEFSSAASLDAHKMVARRRKFKFEFDNSDAVSREYHKVVVWSGQESFEELALQEAHHRAEQRIIGQDLRFDMQKVSVGAVTTLLVRRQFYRSLNTRSRQYILDSLPNLEHLRLESWHDGVEASDRLGLLLVGMCLP